MASRENILILDFLLLYNQGKVPYVQNSSNRAVSFLVILFVVVVISKEILCHSVSDWLLSF